MRNPFVMDCGEFHVNYKQDMAIWKIPRVRMRILTIVILFAIFPLFASDYIVGLATLCGIAAIGAIGLNILTGFTGQISIGVGAFLGVGGYTSAILTTKIGLSFWVAMPVAGVITALIGALFGIPSLRLKGLYLAIATLAAQVIILFVISRWDSLTGGTAGLVLNRPEIGSFSFYSEMSYYYLMFVILVATVLFSLNLFRSRVGRAFIAVRDRDVAAEVTGIDLFKYKVLAFFVSSFFVGIAGALLGHYMMVVSPELYSTTVSIEYLAMILVGGLGSVFGSIYGAVFITLLPVVLRSVIEVFSGIFPDLADVLNGLKEVVFGLVIIIFLIYEPQGLAKIWQNIKDYFKLWPFSY
ncbi:amino acid/amide ABC transporter membrane protein 2, HAAT family [Schinkia azotoformans MEV2011]|uniref:Amino acid/amide ABC transporter membrane protein 2, HAAT family n=1 Tax=Schinkia azotoformans MEV2011 TaxID=1348973 RepID=A0A072NKQ0_SCHAZ|nr:branched-chain amino acid ABC transporter permease [Schinkia azotoformans]KEF38254.1 amino acid/amide ABC transporter membrane protein 2, HAAT family [Schinkia azotoformans MEV2011]MEC1693998.1 branched-chain amino acid ABC transporter permease [Schinkia azotoformans]MEC1724997.1 branched-chain amino acid ABC transporter permease [Schinkia azotoformans]MEC1769785.1 branched-chain amino acid ABC transporter permease [Schinkia azotoformans]MED4367065.1 branched-chain amino acid ABC transporte